MTVRTILEYPHPNLRRPCEPVTEFDTALDSLVGDLVDTLAAGTGIGLSAPQIGGSLQVAVVQLADRKGEPGVFINPEILSKSAWGFVEESCLSVPGITGNVFRATEVRMRALDRTGQPFEAPLAGMDAVCLQHEMDHLVGKLFIDRLSFFKRRRVRAQLAARTV